MTDPWPRGAAGTDWGPLTDPPTTHAIRGDPMQHTTLGSTDITIPRLCTAG